MLETGPKSSFGGIGRLHRRPGRGEVRTVEARLAAGGFVESARGRGRSIGRAAGARTCSKFMKLCRILPGQGSAGSWRHQGDTGTIAPRKPTSSWAPADRKALARSRLLNGKDCSERRRRHGPGTTKAVQFTQPDVSIIRAPPQGASGTKLSSGPCPSTAPQRVGPFSSGNGELAHRAAAWSESRKLSKSRLWPV
jgi:hypothetical protein